MATQQLDPNSFVGVVDSIVAGDSATAKASFQLPAGFDPTGGGVTWSLLDKNGVLYAQGAGSDYIITAGTFNTLVESHAVITAPSELPPTSEGNTYQLRWELTIPGAVMPIYSFQSLQVTSMTSAPIGAETSIEMFNDPFVVGVVTDRVFDSQTFEIYDSLNTLLIPSGLVTVNSPIAVAGGQYYTANIDVANVLATGNPFLAQLDAYILTWKFGITGRPSFTRYTSEIYILNPSILAAVEDCRRMVAKAKMTLLGMPDAMFDDAVIIGWLRRARDMFNSAAGHLLEFTMTNATGGIREFWLQYAEVAMLRAQALAEGEKAFDFQGAEIQLNVDKAQYYNQLADTLQQQLDNNIKPFKQNILKKGAVGGDGNMNGLAGSFAGASRLGISIHPATHAGRYGTNWWR